MLNKLTVTEARQLARRTQVEAEKCCADIAAKEARALELMACADATRQTAASLRGLHAAQIAIDSFIKEARAAIGLNGDRQGRTANWWRGHFEGLVAANAMLALAEFPANPANAVQIERLVASAKKVR